MFETITWQGKVRYDGVDRVVVLPKELILEGEEILIRQDKWGEISIHPASSGGKMAVRKFGPFAD